MEKTYLNDKYQGKQRSWNTVENTWLLTGTAWGGALKKHLIKIERSLNKAVNIMLLREIWISSAPFSIPEHRTVTLKYQSTAVKVHEKVDSLSAPRFHTRISTHHI